ncbi:5'-AMP-activated protein kinase beta subunit, interation domain-containing protein [Lipomyces oligophaga]|uniref:5'-AMP-activated protein kinase beta subunit, interation domain-containing protein n=1 Tax=Lipomyces oligophaga TaxID=45792 RepID=UPI0034CE1B42
MGNSSSQERPTETANSLSGSTSSQSSNTHLIPISGSNEQSGNDDTPSRPHRPRSLMADITDDDKPSANHREDAYEEVEEELDADSTSYAQHVESVTTATTSTTDGQKVKLSASAVDTSITDDGAVDKSIPAKPVSKMLSGEEIDFYHGQPSEQSVPTVISWVHGGKKVYVTGTFTGWRKMIKLTRNGNDFSTVINLPPGTHRIRFVVDNELRCSDALPTATDSMGNLVNYIEVASLELPALERESQLEEEKYEDEVHIPPLEYTNEIPAIFANPAASEKYMSEDYLAPPFLPPHLESVILNTNSLEKDDSSVLPIPNHVVLNHLATTSIKHNVLAVASISRYSRKYVTQILYAPL